MKRLLSFLLFALALLFAFDVAAFDEKPDKSVVMTPGFDKAQKSVVLLDVAGSDKKANAWSGL